MDYLDQQAEKIRKKLTEEQHDVAVKTKQLDADVKEVRALHKITEAAGFKFLFVTLDEDDCRIISAMFQLNLINRETQAAIDPKEPAANIAKQLKAHGYGIIKMPGSKGVTLNKDDITVVIKREGKWLDCKMTIGI